ncbi:transposase domain-containing protein [Streptomyces sp. NPDC060187]|uniref:transposase domain-containing protein n=1 Tax=Streptomyces sp. NPDC060187 TaxID=3347067 RepID=UPI00364AAD3B
MVRYGGQRLCPCFSGGRTLPRSASRGWYGCRRVAGLWLLTWVYRPGLMDRVVAACGHAEHRRRLLPARLVVYFVLAVRNEVLRVRTGVEGPCRWVVAAA